MQTAHVQFFLSVDFFMFGVTCSVLEVLPTDPTGVAFFSSVNCFMGFIAKPFPANGAQIWLLPHVGFRMSVVSPTD